MAAARPPPVPDKALPIDPALYDSPSHVDLKRAEPGPGPVPVPVPFPRENVAGAPSSGVPDGGSRQHLSAIEDRSAPGSGVLPPPRAEASPAASVGRAAGSSSHRGAGRTPEPLVDARYVASNSPNQASFSTQTKDDDLPPLPTPESEASSPAPGIFRRITKRLRPAASPSDPSEAPPTSFQISLPTRSRSRSRSRPRGDDSSAANAPQPLVGKQRKPHVRIPTVPVPKVPAPAPVPNSFTSPENRRAALRARGLVPPPGRGHHQRYERYRDAHGEWMPLSEQEKELDRMFAVVVEDRSPSGENDETEAKKFRDAWLARHRAESEQGHDQAGGASPSLDGHPNGTAAVYADGPGSALPSTTDLAHAEPKKHARQASGRGLSASASAENFRPDLVPAVDPSLPAIPFEQMAAHRLPQAQAQARARDRRSSDVSERVSRWLQTSLRPRSRSRSADAQRPASAGAADDDAKRARFRLFPRRRSVDASIVPTPYHNESDARRSADASGWMQSTRSSLDSANPAPQSLGRRPPARKLPPVPPSAFTPVKERHDAGAVVVTASPSPPPVEAGAGAPLGPANASRTSLDDGQNLRVRRVQVSHRRGRSATVSDPQQAAPLESSSSLVSRSHHSHTMPALSPTRSTSSSELGLPATPTTDTHGCEPPPPPPPPRDYLRPGSSSGRSQTQQSHSQHRQPARQASQNSLSLSRAKPLPRLAHHPPAPPLPQRPPAHARDDRSSTESDLDSSYVEVEVDMEFGVRMRSEAQKMRDLMAAAATASARPRPRRESTDRDDSEKRRSLTLGLFTKKEDADAPPKFRNPRATSSMQNMKRTVTGTLASLKPRAKTLVEDDPYAKAPRSPTLPTSPSTANAPPTSFPQAMATPKRRQSSTTQEQSLSPSRSTVGSGARPRQALSPTIYNRGSILVETGRIEDDESRRLSEMAFLDY